MTRAAYCEAVTCSCLACA